MTKERELDMPSDWVLGQPLGVAERQLGEQLPWTCWRDLYGSAGRRLPQGNGVNQPAESSRSNRDPSGKKGKMKEKKNRNLDLSLRLLVTHREQEDVRIAVERSLLWVKDGDDLNE